MVGGESAEKTLIEAFSSLSVVSLQQQVLVGNFVSAQVCGTTMMDSYMHAYACVYVCVWVVCVCVCVCVCVPMHVLFVCVLYRCLLET